MHCSAGSSATLPIGKAWDWNLWPGEIGNVSLGGSYLKLNTAVIPYPINSSNSFSFLRGGRKRTRRNRATTKQTRRKRRIVKKRRLRRQTHK